MASSASLGYAIWTDGMQWTSLLQRQLDGGAAVWDTGASATAVSPLGGVFAGPGKPLSVSQQASPNMSVLVNAGYCAVAHPTQGHGTYLFGLLAQSTITIAANTSGSARVDIIVARVYDEGSSGSYCDVEVIEGTPSAGQPATPTASILLAAVAVANGASSIGTANITDKRTFTVAPGGVLPATAATAPILGPSSGQLIWNTSEMILQRATAPVYFTQPYTVAGTYTFVAPFTGTISVANTGAAGGASQTTNGKTDGSGGAGEYAANPAYAVIEGDSYTVVVGAGGNGGYDGAGPASGTASTFDGTGVVANPGQGGVASTGGGTGAGGTGSTAPIHYDGGDGASVSSDPPALGGAGGGGAAGPGGPGNPGSAPSGEFGAPGGAGSPGGGDGGQGGFAGQSGADGMAPGGGGGMAGDGSGSILDGGNGADGQVILSWVVTPSELSALAAGDTSMSAVDTSTATSGSSGLNSGSGSSYGWGIGYGATTDNPYYWGGGGSGFDADGQTVQQLQTTLVGDGQTDFSIDAKWGIVVPEAAVDSASPSISSGQCRVIIMLDETVLDTVYLRCAASGGVTQPGDGGSFSYYTSAILGTTPSAGPHTVSLAIQTERTLSGSLSGAHVGDLASVGTSTHPFGSVPSYFTTALTAENCSVRVASTGTTL
jgi:hypothetical protein